MAFVSACAVRVCVFDRARTVLGDYVGWKEPVLIQPCLYSLLEINSSQKCSYILLHEKTSQFTTRGSLDPGFMKWVSSEKQDSEINLKAKYVLSIFTHTHLAPSRPPTIKKKKKILKLYLLSQSKTRTNGHLVWLQAVFFREAYI